MIDITMCQDKTCPRREHCYRYVAIPDSRGQSYFFGSPRGPIVSRGPNAWVCDHYLPVYELRPGAAAERAELRQRMAQEQAREDDVDQKARQLSPARCPA